MKVRGIGLLQGSFGDVRRLLSGVGCDPGSFVSADQKTDLDGRDYDKSSGKRGQPFGILGNSFISRFWPFCLAGAISEALVISLMLWLNRDCPRRVARKQEPE